MFSEVFKIFLFRKLGQVFTRIPAPSAAKQQPLLHNLLCLELKPEGSDYGDLQLSAIVMMVSSLVMDIFSQFITIFILTALTVCHTMCTFTDKDRLSSADFNYSSAFFFLFFLSFLIKLL